MDEEEELFALQLVSLVSIRQPAATLSSLFNIISAIIIIESWVTMQKERPKD